MGVLVLVRKTGGGVLGKRNVVVVVCGEWRCMLVTSVVGLHAVPATIELGFGGLI
jgi:hypothetical protein